MEKTIEAQFKMMANIYLKKIDYADISRLFGKYESYTLDMLRGVYDNSDNIECIDYAKKDFISFVSYQRMEMDGTRVYVSSQDISDYINREGGLSTKTKYYYLIKLAFVTAFYHRINERLEKQNISLDSVDSLEYLHQYHYFRGQTDYEWRMSPSILRNLNMDIVLDDKYYFELLSEQNLEDKYNNLIKATPGFSVENKYNKYAFIQHSTSFSPFIDFTKEPIIAISFSLSNAMRLNDFRNSDSSIICMRFDEQKSDSLITDKKTARAFIKNDMKLEIINSDTFILGKKYELTNSDGRTSLICITSIEELLDRMTPRFKVLDIPTNDRMLYQKGLFICFYNCLCLKDFIAYELCPDLHIAKVCVKKRKKRSILNNIYKNYRQYDPEHLMDPYLYFNE